MTLHNSSKMKRGDGSTTTNLEARRADLAYMRIRFQAVVGIPLQRAMRTPFALDSALQVAAIPLEAAAARFTVNVSQNSDGWHVTIERPIDAETMFHASANAKSLRAALFQVSDRGNEWISHEESNTRTAAAKAKVWEAA